MTPLRPKILRPALTALTLLATPALGVGPETALTNAAPPGPGFWIYPAEPGATDAALTDLCRHGMTLVQPDGSWLSFLATGSGLVVDAEAVCRTESGLQTCAVHLYDAGAPPTAQTHAGRFTRDAQGHLTLNLTVDDRRQMASYPQMCPTDSVRDLMVGWLAP